MALSRPRDKPLSEPLMVRLSTHICVTRCQRVNVIYCPVILVWNKTSTIFSWQYPDLKFLGTRLLLINILSQKRNFNMISARLYNSNIPLLRTKSRNARYKSHLINYPNTKCQLNMFYTNENIVFRACFTDTTKSWFVHKLPLKRIINNNNLCLATLTIIQCNFISCDAFH